MIHDLTKERLWITDMSHPHYGESGYLTGEIIEMNTPTKERMARFTLEDCKHGTDACYVGRGVLAPDKRGPR
jgi:hypothetical protein